MKKASEIIFLILFTISFCALMIFIYYKLVVTINQKEYNETPLIAEVEGRSKSYILNMWLKSGVVLDFITQELFDENTLVYYFKVVEPEYIFGFDYRTYYVKAVYKWRTTGILAYKSWQFDRVMKSNYTEIETILEVKENVDQKSR